MITEPRVTVREAARVLGVSRPTMRAWMRKAGILVDEPVPGRPKLRVRDVMALRRMGCGRRGGRATA